MLRHRNPSPPEEDFDYEVCNLSSYTPHKVFTFEPFQSYLEFLHESLVHTPPTSEVEDETQPVPVETQVSTRVLTIKKEPDWESSTRKTKSPAKEEERSKRHSSKSAASKGARRPINYSDSEIVLSEGEIRETGSSGSDNRSGSRRRKRRRSLSEAERKRKERDDFTRSRQSDREGHRRKHDQKRVSVKKELYSDAESSGEERLIRHRSPEKSSRYKSPKRRSRDRSSERQGRDKSSERRNRYRSPERPSRCRSPERPSRYRSPVESSHQKSPTGSSQYRSPLRSPKQELLDSKDGVFGGVDIFYCKVCQLSLNSELTYDSHIRGKRHAKAIKALSVHEVARGSMELPTLPPLNPDIPRFAVPAPGRRRVDVRAVSKIQNLCNEVKKCPLPGLDRVLEIRTESETTYYCELCDAPCGSSSIMPHLTGFKHQLRFLKEIEPRFYYQNKDVPKNRIEKTVIRLLYDYEKREGRLSIRVVEDIPDPRGGGPLEPYYHSSPGPSWRSAGPSRVKQERAEGENAGASNEDFLDTSKADFYCTVCDSHMNNLNMWEAHIRGKRHLKNVKKVPGENKCKVKTQKLENIPSNLEKELHALDPDDIVVGLNYIKETQGTNGDFYNCFLCSSCSTNADILDHIFNVKHKIKYLKKLYADGIENAIESISDIELRPEFRDSLVEGECRKMLERYGSGKPEVYKKLENLPTITW